MLTTNEKRLLIIHAVLFVVCMVSKIYCQVNMEEWYYQYQYETIYGLTLVFGKPLFYYSLGFLATFFLARKAFRNDLNLPYKMMRIVAAVLLVLYLLSACMQICTAVFESSPLPGFQYYSLVVILEYYKLLCIPGVLFGLFAEKRWNSVENASNV